MIQAGQKLMDIVPENELLLIETRFAPNLIDRVHAGLPVDIRFNSFANSPQLVVDGKVVSVSGDLLAEPQSNVQYYLARVSVTPEGYKKLGKRVMQPGMPVEVVLKTGERSHAGLPAASADEAHGRVDERGMTMQKLMACLLAAAPVLALPPAAAQTVPPAAATPAASRRAPDLVAGVPGGARAGRNAARGTRRRRRPARAASASPRPAAAQHLRFGVAQPERPAKHDPRAGRRAGRRPNATT